MVDVSGVILSYIQRKHHKWCQCVGRFTARSFKHGRIVISGDFAPKSHCIKQVNAGNDTTNILRLE